MMLYKNTKAIVHLPVGDIVLFDIVAAVLQGDIRTLYMFIICLDYVQQTIRNLIKWFHMKKEADDIQQYDRRILRR